jgi:hypothetical protein
VLHWLEETLACRQPRGEQQHPKQNQPEQDEFEVGFFHVVSLLAASTIRLRRL